jgi:hypothetical protein
MINLRPGKPRDVLFPSESGEAVRSPSEPFTRADAPGKIAAAAPETVGLITPSHRGDLERFVMLIESMDRHVRRRGRHYVIVHDEDAALFAPYGSEHRLILPASQFLPRALAPIPLVRWRGRRYWWRFGAMPISGWHAQQIVKIQAVATLPEDRYCLIDSDNFFFRDFDLAEIAAPNPVPAFVNPLAVGGNQLRHIKWIEAAHRLLGIAAPRFPADDFIGQIMVWDQATVQAMIARIAKTTGRDWVAALCREHEFSEYMIYGSFVANNLAMPGRHFSTTQSFCRAHWEGSRLSQNEILRMFLTAPPPEVALCVQSFGETPLSTIRTSLQIFHGFESDAAALLAAAG